MMIRGLSLTILLTAGMMSNAHSGDTTYVRPTPAPFGPGEVFTYSVEYGFINAGKAFLAVVGIDTLSGIPSYHVRSRAESNPTFSTFFRVDDRVDSFIDVYGLSTLRMEKHLREGSYRKDLEADFDTGKSLAYYADGDTVELIPDANDALGALYRLRTLELAVGKVIAIPSHDNKKNYPLEIRVLRKERIKVPAGRFSCYVLEPYLKDEGIFKAKGKMNIWVTDDERMMPVLVRTKVIIGSVNAKLEEYEFGTPIDPEEYLLVEADTDAETDSLTAVTDSLSTVADSPVPGAAADTTGAGAAERHGDTLTGGESSIPPDSTGREGDDHDVTTQDAGQVPAEDAAVRKKEEPRQNE